MKKSQNPSRRKPAAFSLDDPDLLVEESRREPIAAPDGGMSDGEEAPSPSDLFSHLQGIRRSFKWGALFVAALLGLASLSLGSWLMAYVQELIEKPNWVGGTAFGLLCLAVFAFLMIICREILAVIRLKRLGRTRQQAETALRNADKALACQAVASLKSLFVNHKELAWGRARLEEYEKDILTAEDLLRLTERELMVPLDRQAHEIIARSIKRISVVTAVSPIILIDMLFVASENLSMVRRLATLYGGQPGAFGLMRLLRMVVTHLAVSGGLALTADLLHQAIGQKLTAKISAKLGEGLVNGALSARIGLVALNICRPLPYIEATPPRFRELVSKLFTPTDK